MLGNPREFAEEPWFIDRPENLPADEPWPPIEVQDPALTDLGGSKNYYGPNPPTPPAVLRGLAAAESGFPTLELPGFEMPAREFAPPKYRTPFAPDTPGGAELPTLAPGKINTRRIRAKMQQLGAAGQRKVQSAVDRALSYSFEDPNIQAAVVGETIAQQGAGIAGVMGGAGGRALQEYGKELGYERGADIRNFDSKVSQVMQQYQVDLDAARRNYATLSGAYDYDLASAQHEATLNHQNVVRGLMMEMEAKLQKWLLSGVKTTTVIYE